MDKRKKKGTFLGHSKANVAKIRVELEYLGEKKIDRKSKLVLMS